MFRFLLAYRGVDEVVDEAWAVGDLRAVFVADFLIEGDSVGTCPRLGMVVEHCIGNDARVVSLVGLELGAAVFVVVAHEHRVK